MTDETFIEICVSAVGTIFTAGVVWGVTKSQTHTLKEGLKELKEAFRHHIQSEHPAQARDALEDKIALAEVRAVAEAERQRRVPSGEWPPGWEPPTNPGGRRPK